MSNVLLERLIKMYGPLSADGEQAKAMLIEYNRILSPWPEEIQTKAANLLIAEKTFWPMPAEVLQALSRSKNARPSPRINRDGDREEWSEFAKARANRMLHSSFGNKAAKEGWVLKLWDHFRETGEQPTPKQIKRMKRSTEEFHEAHKIAKIGGFAGAKALAGLGDSINERRQEKVEIASKFVAKHSDVSSRMIGEGE